MRIKLTFIEPVLGTIPGSKEIVAEFVAGKLLDTLTPKQQRALFTTTDERKAFIKKFTSDMSIDVSDIPDVPEEVADDVTEKFEQELAAIQATGDLEKASTVFPRDNGWPFVWDYQMKGFFKTACEAMHLMGTMKTETLKKLRLTPYLYKKTINLVVFPRPRRIPFILPDGVNPNELEFYERPLRGQTMKGERICLARSETIPAGAQLIMDIDVMNKALPTVIQDWLDFGEQHGLLQWRSGGFGRFTWEEIASEE